MTSLTDNVQSIGPHPATRTELEARAEGHYAGRLSLDGFGNAVTETGRTLWVAVEFDGPDIDHLHKAKDADANTAHSILSWNSYDALHAENEWLMTLLRAACKTAEIEAIWDKSVCRDWYYQSLALLRTTAIKEPTNAD